MKFFIILFLFASFVLAKENTIFLDYNTLTYGGESNSLLSVNGSYEDRATFFDGDLDIRAGVSFHQNLHKSKNKNNATIIDDSRAIVHSLTLDYYPNSYTLLSLGRQAMDLNLLHGSFDGALITKEYDSLKMRFFYFDHYTTLQSTYYESYPLKNLYGTNIAYSDNEIDSEITIFNNDENKISSIYLSYSKYNIMLGAEHLAYHSSFSFSNHEAGYKLFAAFRHNDFLIQSGIQHVYRGRLRHVYDLGGSEFKSFPLSSFLNQTDAKNIYINLEYSHGDYYAKLHLGKTKFKKKSTSYVGKTLGATLGVRHQGYEFSTMFLTQKSSESTYSDKHTEWLQVNLKYRF